MMLHHSHLHLPTGEDRGEGGRRTGERWRTGIGRVDMTWEDRKGHAWAGEDRGRNERAGEKSGGHVDRNLQGWSGRKEEDRNGHATTGEDRI